jgi:hypothetical protein
MAEKEKIQDMPEKKKISAKRRSDKKMLEKKTKRVEAKVRAAKQLRADIAILDSAGIVPPGKKFARSKKLSTQTKFFAEPDKEIVDAYYKTYRDDSKQGRSDRATIREKGVRKTREYLYFTEITRYCPREVFFRIHMPEKGRDYAVKGLMLFDDGQLHHREAQIRLQREKVLTNPERELILPEIGAVGYYDGLIPVGMDGSGWRLFDIWEMKSKVGTGVLSFSQEDYDQGQLYHYAARFCPTLKRKGIKIRKIRIFNRDRALMIDDPAFGWIIDPDSKRLEEVLQYAHWLHETVIVEKYLCPHPYTRDHAKCGFCRFNSWCWRGFPAPERDQKVVAPDPKAPVPDEEILDSMGKRFIEILKETKKLEDEKGEIAEVFLNYFAKTKVKQYPIQEYDRALAPIMGQKKTILREQLLKALGAEIFSRIATPNSKLLENAVNSGLVTGDIAQRALKYDPKKPYVGVVKIKEEEER